ncbi:MAG: DUF167 domain-containing protein [Bacillota bacterium]|jgi:uncharacterized protein (TIGR00251 family)
MVMIKEKENSVVVNVKVQPRAAKNEIAGVIGDAVKLRVTSPPVDGEANAAVIKIFKNLFRIPNNAISITSGLTSRNKTVEITGVSLEEVKKALKI